MNIPDKAGGVPYTVDEFNSFKNEVQNAIVASGQTLDSTIGNQLELAIPLLAGGGGGTFEGCLAYSTVSFLSSISREVLPLNAELYDTSGIHDNVTNNSRLTVPAGWSGARLTAGLAAASTGTDTEAAATIVRDGLLFADWAGQPFSSAHSLPALGFSSDLRWSLCSGRVLVTPGDYFELAVETDFSVPVALTYRALYWLCMTRED